MWAAEGGKERRDLMTEARRDVGMRRVRAFAAREAIRAKGGSVRSHWSSCQLNVTDVCTRLHSFKGKKRGCWREKTKG